MATFTFFHEWKNTQAGAANLGTDVFKAYLTAAAPAVDTHTVKADLAEISAAGAYAEKTLTTTWAETGAGTGVWRLSIGADQTWTASGGAFDAFRYVVVYDDTVAADPLVGYWDYGSLLTLNDADSLTLDVDANFSAYTLT